MPRRTTQGGRAVRRQKKEGGWARAFIVVSIGSNGQGSVSRFRID